MSAFSALPLVIEPADLASRLDAPELILVDLTSAARYAQGHIPGCLLYTSPSPRDRG